MSGVLADGGSTPPMPPLNPDLTPQLIGASVVPVDGGAMKIWGIPTELIDYLNQMGTGGKLFFAVGKHNVPVPDPAGGGSISGVSLPGLIGPDNAPAQEPPLPQKTKSESYNIMRKPWQVMQQMQALSYNDPAKFVAIQNALASSGAFGTVHVNGTFDMDTEHALANAMLQYVKLSVGTEAVPTYTDPTTGKTSTGFVAYLLNAQQRAKQLGIPGAGSGGTQAPTLNVTDPAAIRAQVIQSAQAALGHSLTDQQINAFVSEFQNQQKNYQLAGPGQTAANPDLNAEAMKYAQSTQPQEYKQHNVEAYTNALLNLLGGSGTEQNISPVAPVGG